MSKPTGIASGAASIAAMAIENARAGAAVAVCSLTHPEARRLAIWFEAHTDFKRAPRTDLDLAEWKFLHPSGGSITIERPPTPFGLASDAAF